MNIFSIALQYLKMKKSTVGNKHLDEALPGKGGSRVACLNFKISRVWL